MAENTTLTKKDFVSDQEIRWCPGCGDYAILSAVQKVFPELGVPKEKFLIVGIGINVISNPIVNKKYEATNILKETGKTQKEERPLK